MQHEDEAAGAPLDDIEVLRALWPHLDGDDKHALRFCCTAMRAMDAQAVCLEEPRWSPVAPSSAHVLAPASCAHLSACHTLTLCSIECLHGMLVQPEPGVGFPRLQSLRLILGEGGLTLEDAADHQAIVAPLLTQLSMRPPASATALPQQMAALLSACSKLEELVLHAYHAEIVDITALAAGTQLQRLEMTSSAVSDLAPLGALVKLQSLDLRHCSRVSDLAPLGHLVKLQSLDISCCDGVSDVASLGTLVGLVSLKIGGFESSLAGHGEVPCGGVSDLSSLASMVKLQSLDLSYCVRVSDLAPLGALTDMQNLLMWKCTALSDLAPLSAMVNLDLCSTSPSATVKTCLIWRPSQSWCAC
ncbi:hypothetical protein FOA52_008338 [Chlamydomonas sp. UWO 241]|nr:hypothetical protein FOA52_008338 [Chlamydomonas sp. UWO 241]